MDTPALAIFTAGAILISGIVWSLTGVMQPLFGYAIAVLCYDLLLLLPLILWRMGADKAVASLSIGVAPTWLWMIALLPGLGLAVSLATKGQLNLPVTIWGGVFAVALINGTLEEIFWRQTILLDTNHLSNIIGALIAFTLWHLALLPARGLQVEGGAVTLNGGAFLLGCIWMFLRLRTGAVGLGAISHVVVNIFAFASLAALNFPVKD